MLLLALMCLTPSSAQQPPRQPTPNDTLVSPEVHGDKRVTFRIYAPKASEVAMRGDWMEGPGTLKLEKYEKGVWSVSVGPLVPDYYSYTFIVDGVRTLDPKNATIKQGITSLDNMFLLSGPEIAFGKSPDAARRDSASMVSILYPWDTAARARLHTARLRRRPRPLSGILLAARWGR